MLLSTIYLAFISLGLPDALVGAGWPVMHTDLGVPVAYAGLITMLIAGGTIVSSLFSDRLTRKLGTGLVTALSVGLTALALIGFSVSGNFWLLCLWAIPYGLGAGAVDAALNNYVALHYSSRHMNWLHAFWGVGASISPFIMSFALTKNLGWESGYRIVGIIQIILAVLLFVSIPLWRKVNPDKPAVSVADSPSTTSQAESALDTAQPEAATAKPLTLAAALRIPGVPLILLAFIAYCALENTAFIWSSTYLVQDRGLSVESAAAFASFFLIGITAGRFLSGFIADKLGDKNLIRFGFLFIGVGALMMTLPVSTSAIALTGFVIAGLGAAPVYPAIIHSTPTNFGRENSQAIIGIQMAAAYTGSTFMPPLFGVLGAWLGMWILPFYILLFVVLGLVMTERLNKLVAARTAQ